MLSKLIKRRVRVLRHKTQCKICGEKVEFYSDIPDEGFGYAAVLYENEFGREIFFHSEEDRAYRGSPAERIVELNEAFAHDGAKIRIRRRQPVAMLCPQCDSRRLESFGDQDEVVIEAYELFGPNA
jgi:hypothetical protein